LQYFSTPSKRERLSELTDGLVLDGKYKVIGRIGGGGQGTAYLAVVDDGKERSEVVLKEYVLPVHKGTAIMQQTLEKLKKETELLQRLDHPNIVKCLGYFVEDYRGYVVLEYIDGESLKEIVSKQGPMPESQALNIGIRCCEILEYLHNAAPPIIHRDITPDNIMCQMNGEIKLVDFNVAHQLESSATATVVGKHCYLPPEQFRGKPVPASDLYALGGTLNYILTAVEPEPITSSHPRKLQSELSHGIDEIVAKATEPKLERRYASAAHLKSELILLTPPTI
jgi:serine/threonine-protein kinase